MHLGDSCLCADYRRIMKRLIILVLLICVCTNGCNFLSTIEPALEKQSNSETGGYGPFVLAFNFAMQKDSVEDHIQILPKTLLDFYWEENKIFIYPRVGLEPDREYLLVLQEGSMTESGDVISRELSWKLKAHAKCIVYIGDATKSPELWRLCQGEELPEQLTNTGGRIYDFEVSYDGNLIVYSRINEKNGTEIWIIDRRGLNTESILDCVESICGDLTLSADNKWLAFTRRVSGTMNGNNSSKSQIVIMNLATNEEFVLLENESIAPSEMMFSPRGNYLSFYEGNSGSFWIINLDTQRIEKLDSDIALGGTWTSDGNGFIYVTPQYWGGIPYDIVQLWDISNNYGQYLFGDETEQFEYFYPQWQPGGDWILVATRPVRGSSSKQIWLISPDGSKSLQITDQEVYTHSSYSWSPNGKEIVYQRYALAAVDAVPEIAIWNLVGQKTAIIATDATSPKWLP